MKKVGEQIALIRKEKGLTQEKLAEGLSVSPQAVSKWENGHALPETSLLPILAKLLDCSVYDLCPSKASEAKKIWTREIREAQADMFVKALELEKQAKELAKEFTQADGNRRSVDE